MFSRIRKRITYTNVLLTIALVFAMTGGAYAAKKYLITSTKQISPTVLKQLTGKAGQNGTAGAAGTAGPAGPVGAAGPQGPQGPAGTNGTNGKPGKDGNKGETGEKGETGAPWPAGGVLPPGATETGQWAIYTKAAAAGEINVEAISFPIPLEAAPAATFVKLGDPVPSECAGGSAADPKAANGHLCIFEGESALPPIKEEAGHLVPVTQFDGSGDFGPAPTGADLIFQTTAPPPSEREAAVGSWAVTGA